MDPYDPITFPKWYLKVCVIYDIRYVPLRLPRQWHSFAPRNTFSFEHVLYMEKRSRSSPVTLTQRLWVFMRLSLQKHVGDVDSKRNKLFLSYAAQWLLSAQILSNHMTRIELSAMSSDTHMKITHLTTNIRAIDWTRSIRWITEKKQTFSLLIYWYWCIK